MNSCLCVLQEMQLRTRSQRIRSFMQIKIRQHLSWPIEGNRSLRHSSAAAKTPAYSYVPHHGVLRGYKIEMLHYSGPDKRNAHVRCDTIDIREKLSPTLAQIPWFEDPLRPTMLLPEGLKMVNSN